MRGKGAEIPAIAPELAHRALWPPLTIKDRRVLLISIKMRRKHHPREHLLAIGSGDPSLLYLNIWNGSKESIILSAQLLHRCLRFPTLWCLESIDIGGVLHRLQGVEEVLTIACKAHYIGHVVVSDFSCLETLNIYLK